MFELLIVGAIAYFAGLGTAVLVPDLIKRRSPKE
jgi:hypothetical protein